MWGSKRRGKNQERTHGAMKMAEDQLSSMLSPPTHTFQHQVEVSPVAVAPNKKTHSNKKKEMKLSKLDAAKAATDACIPSHTPSSMVPGANLSYNQLEGGVPENMIIIPAVLFFALLLVGFCWTLFGRKQRGGIIKRSSSLHVLCHEQQKSLQKAQQQIVKLEADLKARSETSTGHLLAPQSPERQVEPRGAGDASGDEIIVEEDDGEHADREKEQPQAIIISERDSQMRENESKIETLQLSLHLKEKSQQESSANMRRNTELLEQVKAELHAAREREKELIGENNDKTSLLKQTENMQAQLADLEQQKDEQGAKLEQANSELIESNEERATERQQARELQDRVGELAIELELSKTVTLAQQKEWEQRVAHSATDFRNKERQLQNQVEERTSCLEQQKTEFRRIKEEKQASQLDFELQLSAEVKQQKLANTKVEELSSEKEELAAKVGRMEQENSSTIGDLKQQVQDKSAMIATLQSSLEALGSDKQKLGVKVERVKQENRRATDQLQQEVEEKASMIVGLHSKLDGLEAANQMLTKELANKALNNDSAGGLDDLPQQLAKSHEDCATLESRVENLEADNLGLATNLSEERRLLEDARQETDHLQTLEKRLAGETNKRKELESKIYEMEKEESRLVDALEKVQGGDESSSNGTQKLLEDIKRLKIENATMSEKKQQLKNEHNRMKEQQSKMKFMENDRRMLLKEAERLRTEAERLKTENDHNTDLKKRLEDESARKTELQSKLEVKDRDNRKLRIELGELKLWNEKSDEKTTDSSVAYGSEDDNVEKLRHEVAELTASLKATKEGEANLVSDRERLVENATNMSLILAENRAEVDFLQLQLDDVKQNSQHGNSMHGSSSLVGDSSERSGGGGLSGGNRGTSGSVRGARFRTFLQNRVFKDVNSGSDDGGEDDTE